MKSTLESFQILNNIIESPVNRVNMFKLDRSIPLLNESSVICFFAFRFSYFICLFILYFLLKCQYSVSLELIVLLIIKFKCH